MTVEITAHDRLPGVVSVQAHMMYSVLFSEINTLAAQRHLMTRAEFCDVADDYRVTKYLAYDGPELVGISTMTNHLDAWPLISPRYFARRFPREYERADIWYVGFVGAARPHVFAPLVAAMYPRVRTGIVAMDFCTRRQFDGLPVVTHKLLERLAGPDTRMGRLDDQATYAYRFDGAEFGGPGA